MARTWRNERTTPKKPPVQAPVRPRMNEFAREYYQGLGYTPEIPVDDTMTGPAWADNPDVWYPEALAYLEADA